MNQTILASGSGGHYLLPAARSPNSSPSVNKRVAFLEPGFSEGMQQLHLAVKVHRSSASSLFVYSARRVTLDCRDRDCLSYALIGWLCFLRMCSQVIWFFMFLCSGLDVSQQDYVTCLRASSHITFILPHTHTHESHAHTLLKPPSHAINMCVCVCVLSSD